MNGDLAFGPPKTNAGRRSVSLPATLAARLAEQLEQPEVGRADLAFPTPLGEPMRHSNFARRVWRPATKQVGVDGLRFHDLRVTAVALAISTGAHPKAIQERVGHSSITVTLDRYGHLFDGLDDLLHISRGLTAACDADTTHAAAANDDGTAGQDGWAQRGSNPRPFLGREDRECALVSLSAADLGFPGPARPLLTAVLGAPAAWPRPGAAKDHRPPA